MKTPRWPLSSEVSFGLVFFLLFAIQFAKVFQILPLQKVLDDNPIMQKNYTAAIADIYRNDASSRPDNRATVLASRVLRFSRSPERTVKSLVFLVYLLCPMALFLALRLLQEDMVTSLLGMALGIGGFAYFDAFSSALIQQGLYEWIASIYALVLALALSIRAVTSKRWWIVVLALGAIGGTALLHPWSLLHGISVDVRTNLLSLSRLFFPMRQDVDKYIEAFLRSAVLIVAIGGAVELAMGGGKKWGFVYAIAAFVALGLAIIAPDYAFATSVLALPPAAVFLRKHGIVRGTSRGFYLVWALWFIMTWQLPSRSALPSLNVTRFGVPGSMPDFLRRFEPRGAILIENIGPNLPVLEMLTVTTPHTYVSYSLSDLDQLPGIWEKPEVGAVVAFSDGARQFFNRLAHIFQPVLDEKEKKIPFQVYRRVPARNR